MIGKSRDMPTDILEFFRGKKVLITGGRGYLGTNLVSLLRSVECEIIRIDRSKPTSQLNGGKAEIKDVTADIRLNDFWGSVIDGVDVVFHFAAQTSVYEADENPVEDFRTNVLPIVQLLEVCKKGNRKPIILFSGTVTEIGLPVYRPVDESHPDKPITVYDLHKLTAENLLKFYCEQEVVKGAVLRLSNVYGPGPTSSSADRGILNLMIRKALKGEALTLYGKGESLRDYIFVEDVVRAFLAAVTKIENLNGRHFVIGTGVGHSLKEAFDLVAECVERKTQRSVKVETVEPPVPQSPINARNFVADSRRFCELTNWKPEYSLREGINRTIDFFRESA